MDQNNNEDEDAADKRSIALGLSVSLLLAPIIFQLTSFFNSNFDLFVSILTLTFSIILIVSINKIFQLRCRSVNDLKRSSQIRSAGSSVFSRMFSSIYKQNETNQSNKRDMRQSQEAQPNLQQGKRKIDPKYFKPKFIIHELYEFWGTTYTVITWGSFYLIGGTVVATERLARKIKTKCTKNQQNFNNSTHTYSGSTSGATSFSTSSDSDETITEPRRDSNNRMFTWTKKTFTSITRKFSKFASQTSTPRMSFSALGSGATQTPMHSHNED